VIYGSGSACPTFAFLQTISAYAGNATAPTASKLAEVHFFDNFLYVADRVDKLFSGDNSIETLSLDSTGALTFLQSTILTELIHEPSGSTKLVHLWLLETKQPPILLFLRETPRRDFWGLSWLI
jgi:hypothetical protein